MESLTRRRLVAQAHRKAARRLEPVARVESAAALHPVMRYVAEATPQLTLGVSGLSLSGPRADTDEARLLRQLDDALRRGVSEGVRPQDASTERAKVAELLLRAADAFAVAHERSMRSAPADVIPMVRVLDADAAAFEAMADALPGLDRATLIAGVAAHFAAAQLLGRCAASAHALEESHPSRSDRITALTASFIARHDAATVQRGVLLSSCVSECLENAWLSLAPQRWLRAA